MTTPEDWQSIQAHFDRLCDLAPSDQQAELDRLALPGDSRTRIEQLLAFDGGVDLDLFAGDVGRMARELEESSLVGTRVGAYRLVRLLGEGGMGDVYLAERTDGRFDSLVAVKFLATRDLRGQRLFDRERRILARLNHPAIARMIDAGEHDCYGAYIVMEYVDGLALNRFIQQTGSTALGVIGWICRAAEAVAYAHQNLVLHRDLKPDHLMVTPANALKVLDFGVAALVDQETTVDHATARDSFTPRYAAPEQLLGQPATTRTDVYALALMLFEMLAGGDNPFGNDPQRLVGRKLAAEQDPLPQVPQLSRRQQRDLACIVEKALALDPAERYSGPGPFAADLEAVCANRPIALRRPSSFELGVLWLQKNRLAGAAVLIALVALVGAAVTATAFGHRARIERDQALLEAAKAREIASFLESIFETSSPGIDKGPDVLARDLLDLGRERIAAELSGHPEVAAALELSMARSYLNLGMYDEALTLLETDRPGIARALADERRVLSARLDNLAGRYENSLERLADPAISPAGPNQQAEAEVARAVAYMNLGDIDSSERAAKRIMQLADDTPEGLELKLTARSLHGAIVFQRGDYANAQKIYEESHRLTVQRYGEISDRAGLALHNLGGVAFMAGDLETAVATYEDAIRVYEKFFGTDNRAVAMSLRSLGLSYRRLGRSDDAEAKLRRSMVALEAWNGRESVMFQEAALQLLELLLLTGRREDMLLLLRGLPDLAESEGPGDLTTACRLRRLRQVFDALAPDAANCIESQPVAAYNRAFDRYIDLVARVERGIGGVEPARAAALNMATDLIPPDPLLVAAIKRL